MALDADDLVPTDCSISARSIYFKNTEKPFVRIHKNMGFLCVLFFITDHRVGNSAAADQLRNSKASFHVIGFRLILLYVCGVCRVCPHKFCGVFDNSCSSNVADVLELVGILAHDPRNLPTPVTPAELLGVLSKSNRLVKKSDIQSMQIHKFIICIFLGAVAACSKEPLKKYMAMKDTTLYKEPIDGTQDISYVVKKGETCYFGKEVTKKVYLFKEATCENGSGWTPDWMDFKEINND